MLRMKNENLEFIVPGSLKDNFLYTRNNIEGYLNKQEMVPPSLVKYLLGCLLTKNKIKKRQNQIEAKAAAERVYERIKSNQSYQFEWRYVVPGNEKESNHNLLTISEIIFQAYFDFNRKDNKDDAIRFFYEVFDKEVVPANTKRQKSLSKYKKSVLAGVFTVAAGYLISSKSKLTWHDYFDFTRNALKKYFKKS